MMTMQEYREKVYALADAAYWCGWTGCNQNAVAWAEFHEKREALLDELIAERKALMEKVGE